MCRSIKRLFNFQPPVTEEEIRAAVHSLVAQGAFIMALSAVVMRPWV